MADSIFTQIIKGDIPSHKIYEDELTFAFLDINPYQPGHTLVIPKKQIEFLWDLPDEDYQAVMATAKKVADRLKEVLKPKFVGLEVVGVDVPHAHVHVIPFNSPTEFKGQSNRPKSEDHEALATLAKKLSF
jgi:histidine triad (HIT) family protein